MGMSSRLLPEEVIVFQTRKHKVIFFIPVVLTIVALYAYPFFSHSPMLEKVVWTLFLVPGIFFLYSLVEYMTSIFIVTNKRIMMREGFFTRHTNETLLTSISQVTVDQNLIAQLLNYGTVTVNAFGASDTFVMIAGPYLFQQALNEQVNRTSRR
jgi:uncharacterized membrane protein YdbT with pleckstrin-like domain